MQRASMDDVYNAIITEADGLELGAIPSLHAHLDPVDKDLTGADGS